MFIHPFETGTTGVLHTSNLLSVQGFAVPIGSCICTQSHYGCLHIRIKSNDSVVGISISIYYIQCLCLFYFFRLKPDISCLPGVVLLTMPSFQ
jgi:hypothetical protein